MIRYVPFAGKEIIVRLLWNSKIFLLSGSGLGYWAGLRTLVMSCCEVLVAFLEYTRIVWISTGSRWDNKDRKQTKCSSVGVKSTAHFFYVDMCVAQVPHL